MTSSQVSEKIQEIILKINALGFADRIIVFGSVSRLTRAVLNGEILEKDPIDLDICIQFYDSEKFQDISPMDMYALRDILQIALENYGYLDPFIQTKTELFVRTDSSQGWKRAKNADSIARNIKSEGMPFLEVVHALDLHFANQIRAKKKMF